MFISAMVLTSVDILTAYLPLLGEARGISPAAVGALLGVRGVASMVSRIFLGRLAARWSTSALILWSTAGSAVAVLTVALTTNPIPLSIAMVIGGFFLGMAQPLTITVVIAALQPRDRTQGLALRMFGNHLAQTAVPLLAGVAALAIGPSSAFLAQGAALAVSTAWETLARRNCGDHKRSNS
jgi:predicted MFS family arabinose efflux permease